MDLRKYFHADPEKRSKKDAGSPSKPAVSSPKDPLRPQGGGITKRQSTNTSKASSSSVEKAIPSKYAEPSRYAHLSELVDVLEPDLILAFVGLNPGIATAVAGHAYAHPTNLFWYLLHTSGLTPDRRLSPTEDRSLPKLYQMGWTNIVARPTKGQNQLSKQEMVEGAGILEEKFRKWRPEAICLVGKGIWEAVFKYKHGRGIRKEEFKYGWQDESENMGRVTARTAGENEEPWAGSRVFVATSTSGQAASMSLAEKQDVWTPLGEWVQKRREERQQPAST